MFSFVVAYQMLRYLMSLHSQTLYSKLHFDIWSTGQKSHYVNTTTALFHLKSPLVYASSKLAVSCQPIGLCRLRLLVNLLHVSTFDSNSKTKHLLCNESIKIGSLNHV